MCLVITTKSRSNFMDEEWRNVGVAQCDRVPCRAFHFQGMEVDHESAVRQHCADPYWHHPVCFLWVEVRHRSSGLIQLTNPPPKGGGFFSILKLFIFRLQLTNHSFVFICYTFAKLLISSLES